MPTISGVVTSRTNARVKQLRGAFAGQARLSGGLVAIEGDHLVQEALRSGMLLKSIFLSNRRELPGYIPPSVEVLRLAEEVFASVVETRSPQGIAALMVPPVWDRTAVMRGVPLLLIVVGLQDPGNLGTLIRSAEAFGASGVVSTQGTVSVWNGKAVRASVGSVFRVPVVIAEAEEIEGWKTLGIRLLAAVGEGEGAEPIVEIGDVDLASGVALLVGNEGSGLGSRWIAMADAQVTIPCTGAVESLNAAVAGSVMLYEAQRQRSRVGVRT